MASGCVVEALAELWLLFGLLIVKGKMGWHFPRQCPWADPRVEGLTSEPWGAQYASGVSPWLFHVYKGSAKPFHWIPRRDSGSRVKLQLSKHIFNTGFWGALSE